MIVEAAAAEIQCHRSDQRNLVVRPTGLAHLPCRGLEMIFHDDAEALTAGLRSKRGDAVFPL
jgi:hypothetical protein